MSCFAQGSRSGLSYVTESTYGTNPGGTFTPIPYNTHSLSLTKERVTGNEIQPDRMLRVDRHGNKQVGGDIAIDMRADSVDDFIESVMFSTFASDAITIGSTEKSFTIQDYAEDIDYARIYTGMIASSWSVSIAPNQMVSSTFGFVGKDGSITQTQESVGSLTTTQPFDAYSGDIFLQDAGSTDAAIANVTAVEFTLDNALSPNFIIGQDSVKCFSYGMASVEGTLTAFFEDDSLINRFIDETETELKVSVNDPTGLNEYTFNFPRIKVNSADTPVDGPESRLVTMSFVALYDATETSNFIVTRS